MNDWAWRQFGLKRYVQYICVLIALIKYYIRIPILENSHVSKERNRHRIDSEYVLRKYFRAFWERILKFPPGWLVYFINFMDIVVIQLRRFVFDPTPVSTLYLEIALLDYSFFCSAKVAPCIVFIK